MNMLLGSPERMTTLRRWASAMLLSIAAWPAVSQTYPAKPIRVFVPFVAGSGGDVAARIVTTGLAQAVNQPVIVENRAGAGESIAAEMASRATPDGYTLLICSANAMVFRPYLSKVVTYDSVRDFTAVTEIADAAATIVVNPSLPVSSLKELIDYAKSRPGKVAYGTSGIGTSHHLSAEQIQRMAGVNMLHVPYKSGIQPFNDVMAGLIPVSIVIMGTLTPQLKSGKIRVIAVISGERNRRIPDVATVAETLPGFSPPPAWLGLFAPAGLSQPLLRRVHAEAVKAIQRPEGRSKLEQMGFDPVANSPEQFAAMIKRDLELVGRVVKAAGIQPTD